MTDRDQFAAAALTGLLSDKANQWPAALQWEHLLTHAYRWADAMLRERERTDLDAAPAARARTDAAAGEPGGGAGTGSTQEPVAWAADIPGKYGAAPTMLFGYTKNLVKGIAAAGGDLVEPFPLYRTPQTCPYVVGKTTLHCSLTPFALTDEEREAIACAAESYADNDDDEDCQRIAVTLGRLLERTK